jgi:hypothetical protein
MSISGASEDTTGWQDACFPGLQPQSEALSLLHGRGFALAAHAIVIRPLPVRTTHPTVRIPGLQTHPLDVNATGRDSRGHWIVQDALGMGRAGVTPGRDV